MYFDVVVGLTLCERSF